MNQHEQLLAVSEGFFDAALEPASWVQHLERFAHCVGAVGADVHLLKDDVLLCNYMGAQPATLLQEYTERFLDREPRSQALRGLRPGQLLTDRDVVDAETMRRHPYYADFLPRAGLGQCIAAAPVNASGRRAYFGLHLAPSAGAPSATLVAAVQAVQPRLSRALNAQFRMMEIELKNIVCIDLLDRLDCGLAVLNSAGKLMLANAGARALFDQAGAVRLSGERITAPIPAEARRLHTLVQSALSGQGLRGGSTIVHGPDGQTLSVVVDPLTSEMRERCGSAVVVYLSDLRARAAADREQTIRQLFGFTPAESRVAIGIATGETVKRVAQDIGITYETARFTLKRVYEKLDVHKQGELVALIDAALPPMRSSQTP
jgi:DNA-binding CsgD family transcriptional regulator